MYNVVIAPLPHLCHFVFDPTNTHMSPQCFSPRQCPLCGTAPASTVHPCMVIKLNAARFSMRQRQQTELTLRGHHSDLFLFLLRLLLFSLVLFPTVCLSKGQSLGCLLRMLTSQAERWDREQEREGDRPRPRPL